MMWLTVVWILGLYATAKNVRIDKTETTKNPMNQNPFFLVGGHSESKRDRIESWEMEKNRSNIEKRK